jgi:DeoR/GlpR family transcriptional regulator of sugar metabolism
VHRDSPFLQRLSSHTPEKQRLAKAAAALIGDGETLLINGGSTTRFFAAELTQPNLTIVTNNLAIPGALSNELGAEIYLLGGQFRAGPQVTIGPVAPAGIHVAVDTAIIGIGGLTAREGLSTTILEEASMIAAMIAAARRTIVVADSSKLGKHSFARIGPLTSIQLLVTDAEPPRELRTALEDARVQIVLG